MKNLFLSSILVFLTLYSCSNIDTKVSTGNSFHIVELPDGSTAYLNHHSSIEYNNDFEERKILQEGEVFYQVERGNSPFIVKTQYGIIEVLGTEFNVKSNQEVLEVEVEEGLVDLKVKKLSTKVRKGEKAFFKELDKGIKISIAEFNHKKWMKELDVSFKQLSKEVNKETKKLQKESKKIGTQLKKELKKLN